MQVLVDLDFFPHEIGLDGSIAVRLIRDYKQQFKENVLFPEEKALFAVGNGSRHVHGRRDFLSSPRFELWEDVVWGRGDFLWLYYTTAKINMNMAGS